MESWLIRLLTVVSTFSIGLVLTALFLVDPQHIEYCGGEDHRAVQVTTQVATSNDFIHEFRDLPEFDFDYELLKGKIVHLGSDSIYRRSELVARNGENWLVLSKRNDAYSLTAATAKVRKLSSTSWPGDEKDAKLSFRVTGKPMMALRNVRGIRPGRVETLFSEESWTDPDAEIRPEEISDDYRRDFVLGGVSYTLRTSRALSADGVELDVLVLESKHSVQVLDQIRRVANERSIIGTLLWVGDLDRDGKLDVYFDHFNEIGAFSSTLYLSSHASNGHLVKAVAVFGTAGC